MSAQLVPGSPVARAVHDLIGGRRGVVLDPARASLADRCAFETVAHLLRLAPNADGHHVVFPMLADEVEPRAAVLVDVLRQTGFPDAEVSEPWPMQGASRRLQLRSRRPEDLYVGGPDPSVELRAVDEAKFACSADVLILTNGVASHLLKSGARAAGVQVLEVRRKPKRATAELFATSSIRPAWGPMPFEVLLAGAP